MGKKDGKWIKNKWIVRLVQQTEKNYKNGELDGKSISYENGKISYEETTKMEIEMVNRLTITKTDR